MNSIHVGFEYFKLIAYCKTSKKTISASLDEQQGPYLDVGREKVLLKNIVNFHKFCFLKIYSTIGHRVGKLITVPNLRGSGFRMCLD